MEALWKTAKWNQMLFLLVRLCYLGRAVGQWLFSYPCYWHTLDAASTSSSQKPHELMENIIEQTHQEQNVPELQPVRWEEPLVQVCHLPPSPGRPQFLWRRASERYFPEGGSIQAAGVCSPASPLSFLLLLGHPHWPLRNPFLLSRSGLFLL